VPRAKALPVMHDHSRQVVDKAVGSEGLEGLSAAIRLHVQRLIKMNMDANLLTMIASGPPGKLRQMKTYVLSKEEHSILNDVLT